MALTCFCMEELMASSGVAMVVVVGWYDEEKIMKSMVKTYTLMRCCWGLVGDVCGIVRRAFSGKRIIMLMCRVVGSGIGFARAEVKVKKNR